MRPSPMNRVHVKILGTAHFLNHENIETVLPIDTLFRNIFSVLILGGEGAYDIPHQERLHTGSGFTRSFQF